VGTVITMSTAIADMCVLCANLSGFIILVAVLAVAASYMILPPTPRSTKWIVDELNRAADATNDNLTRQHLRVISEALQRH
jgi:hypothetical protein